MRYSEKFIFVNNQNASDKNKQKKFFFVSNLGRGILEMTLNIRIPAAALDLALSFGPFEHGHQGQPLAGENQYNL